MILEYYFLVGDFVEVVYVKYGSIMMMNKLLCLFYGFVWGYGCFWKLWVYYNEGE